LAVPRLPAGLTGLVLLAALASAGEEPETRAAAWRRQRIARQDRLRPYRPGFVERQMLAIEKAERPSILDFNLFGAHPRIQGIAAGSQTAAGVRLWRPDMGGSPVSLHASGFYSKAGYEYYDLQLGKIPHRGRAFPLRSVTGDDVYELGDHQTAGPFHLILYGSARYRHYPREGFFGLGPGSRRQDRTSFLRQDASYDLVAGYQVSQRLALTARAGLLQAFVGTGEDPTVPTIARLFGDASAPGLARQPDFFYLSPQLFLDFRDEPGNPHRGGMLALQLHRFDDRGGQAFRFSRFAVDARGFVPLGSPQRTLALRVLASFDDAAAGSRVPFYLQETLGGSHTLRGYPNFRFRGEDLLLLQAEYRWEASPALELSLFVDGGRVAARASDLDLSGLRTDWGFGVRLKTFRSVLARFDWARSAETTRALLRFSPSF
jgi:hypothetical protein